MRKFSHIVVVSVLVLLVSACKSENHTYQYLVTHPRVLEKEFNRCQTLLQKTQEQEDQCKIVSNAVQMVTDTISSQRHDPEKFGLRILVAEIALNDYKGKLTHAEEKLTALKEKASSESAIKKAQEEVQGLTQAYNDKRDEVKMLLAIMGMSTPE